MEINKMHQAGTVPITCLSGWLCSKCKTMYSGEREELGQAEVFMSVISLSCLCCIPVFFFFHSFFLFSSVMATCHIHLD